MKVVIIVQARMTSTRLPGKVMRPILDRPLLGYLLERLGRVERAASTVVATTTNDSDDPIVDFCEAQNVPVYRGSEHDVLSRFYEAAKAEEADVVVRVTADCPLIDPLLIDSMIKEYKESDPPVECLSNTVVRCFPRGMDAEVFSFKALSEAHQFATESYEREHVTPFIYANPQAYPYHAYMCPGSDLADLRLTVDEEDDFTLVRTVLEALYPEKHGFHLRDVVKLLEEHPHWVSINSHVRQKTT